MSVTLVSLVCSAQKTTYAISSSENFNFCSQLDDSPIFRQQLSNFTLSQQLAINFFTIWTLHSSAINFKFSQKQFHFSPISDIHSVNPDFQEFLPKSSRVPLPVRTYVGPLVNFKGFQLTERSFSMSSLPKDFMNKKLTPSILLKPTTSNTMNDKSNLNATLISTSMTEKFMSSLTSLCLLTFMSISTYDLQFIAAMTSIHLYSIYYDVNFPYSYQQSQHFYFLQFPKRQQQYYSSYSSTHLQFSATTLAISSLSSTDTNFPYSSLQPQQSLFLQPQSSSLSVEHKTFQGLSILISLYLWTNFFKISQYLHSIKFSLLWQSLVQFTSQETMEQLQQDNSHNALKFTIIITGRPYDSGILRTEVTNDLLN